MDSLTIAIVVAWFAGSLALLLWWGNNMRLALNNLLPGTRFSEYAKTSIFGFRFVARAIKPERLTELGRSYRLKAMRIEWIMLVWGILSMLLLGTSF
ncbi:hypothetical protein [Bradyrhizobium sp. Ce-3]|uniref:hypothetical protein n=1 Tax=Bradyrhizobium sp. Ce-3 TaxID=2913970 RepID=UPI001FC80BD7|nr:hypothetical protein [Bradyrhizobium sp. Ce-3]GKQ52854.1 hypothetical protein BRSPCE3_37090 [Bradyrhizobium sp. Ce-3]